MKRRYKSFSLLRNWLLAISVFAVPFAALGQQVLLKMGTVDNPKSHSGVGAEAFAAEVDKLSNGTMKVAIFHSGQLGSIEDQIKNVFSAAQDLHLLYPEFLSNITPETRISSAPYVFQDLEDLQKYYKSPLFQPAIDKLSKLGATILDPNWTWLIKDPRGVVATRPIRTPDDLVGLKLRIWESKIAIDTWRGFGASPVVISRPEMYLAFKQGIIQGGPETIGLVYDQKTGELAKYWTKTEEYHQILNILINSKKLKKLTAEQQDILYKAAAAAAIPFTAETVRGYTEKKEKAIKEMGVSILEPDLTPWREKAKETVKKMEADGLFPKGAVDAISKL